MPVTAKLSRKFYERFGDELTNELVEWFNQVDATCRSELRELNELNFARFDAKLVSEIERAFGRLETRMATFETRIVRSPYTRCPPGRREPLCILPQRRIATTGHASASANPPAELARNAAPAPNC